MAECYICCLTPHLAKMKAFPTCSNHPDGCGRSLEEGDLVSMDGMNTICVNGWMIAVPVRKLRKDSKGRDRYGCHVGYCKVVFSQFRLVVNRKAQVTELIPDTNEKPDDRTSNMGKMAMGCAKVSFLDGKHKDEVTLDWSGV